MTPERWRRLEELYHAALRCSDADRAAFIARACADDEPLRRELELLVAQAASARLAEHGAFAGATSVVPDSSVSALSGRRIGTYQVLECIGVGGMGEVYRARDTRLGRDVALKILPRAFLSDPDRLARFEREARILASLNHPHIASIYGIEEADSLSPGQAAMRALVLELVPGETLAERIRRGPMAVKDALAIAGQIAEALDAAHERGIVHRDLKPANVKVTDEGMVKVLDFGLAKAIVDEGSLDMSQLATMAVDPTREGVIVGTVAYMSPEQARGKAVDKRTDIWAFGCVLYEMLTGHSAFARPTASDTIAAVLERTPDWSALPATTPSGIRHLITRCLEKDPKLRLRDIGDARLEIAHERPGDEAAGDASTRSALPAARARRRRLAWAFGAVAVLAGVLTGAAAILRQGGGNDPAETVRSVVTLPQGVSLELARGSLFAVSPDGGRLVYSASLEGRVRLYARALDRFSTDAIEGTDGAIHPFFSPDGRWIGFFAQGALRKVPVEGGTATVICEAALGHGASWAPDNTIVFAQPGSGLMRVSADGGTPQPITALTVDRSETGHDWPQILPGGRNVLFTIVIGNDNGVGVGVAPIEGGDVRVVAARRELGVDAAPLLPPGDLVQTRYVASGHLVYGQVGAVWAMPFDLAQLQTQGSPIEMLADVFEGQGGGAIYFAVTARGSLAYVPGGTDRSLVRIDRTGRPSPISETRGAFRMLRLSPDGQRLAVCIDVPRAPTSIWMFDMQRGTATRVTTVGHNLMPVWTPDGRRIAHTGTRGLHILDAEGGGSGEPLPSRQGEPYSWTPDGRTLLFSLQNNKSQWDLWAVTLSADATTPVLVTPDNERLPAMSPDGRWLAYASDESGRYEVYVRPFRRPGARVQVSLEGGTEPVWSRDGRELFFRRDNEYYAAPVQATESFDAGRPQYLFTYGVPFVSSEVASYDVTPDGQYVVMIDSDPDSAPTHFRLVTRWVEELSERVPAALQE
jgi:Tol biopolymer transport system component